MANAILSFQRLVHTQAILKASLLALSALAFLAPSTAVAQSTQVDANQKSVLHLVGDSNPATSSGANGSARIEDINPQATYTRQKFSPAPQPPSDLLVPSNEKSNFTKPLVNELRIESLSTDNATQTKNGGTRTQNDGSEAVGTFATTNQNFQDQTLPGQRPMQQGATRQGQTTPSPTGFGFQPPASLRATGNATSNLADTPSIRSSAQAATQPPAIRANFGTGSNGKTSNQNGVWRDVAPRTNQSSNVRSFNVASESSGQSSRSNAMQPLRSMQSQPNQAPPIQRSFNAQPTERFAAQPRQGNLRDNLVRPTTFTQPVPPKKRSTDLAKTLMARYAVDNFSGALPGQPVKMLEMLQQPISTEQRRPMVNQFWLTYYDWANKISDQQFEQWLNRIPAATSAADKAMIDAAKAIAKNRTLSAEIQLGKSQSQLMQYMPNRQSNLLPLPNDLPLIQNYRTNYEAYKSQRMLPVSLLGIDEMLPKTLELIKQRADAVRVAKSAADTVISALSTRQSTIATVLEAGDVWRKAEHDLIASVVDYNQAIGDYSLSIPHGYQAPEQVVKMLIAPAKATSVAQAPQGQSGFRNPQTQGSQVNANTQSQAELRRRIAAQQRNAVSQGNQNQNGNQFGGRPPNRPSQANPNQTQRGGFGGQQPASPSTSGQNQPQGTQRNFNLNSSQFGGGIGGSETSSAAPMTRMGTGAKPPKNPFADSASRVGQSTQGNWGQ
jgi:hypothetical protein